MVVDKDAHQRETITKWPIWLALSKSSIKVIPNEQGLKLTLTVKSILFLYFFSNTIFFFASQLYLFHIFFLERGFKSEKRKRKELHSTKKKKKKKKSKWV